jgi:hypothetical protein
MMKCKFLVEVPMADTDSWFTLCECLSPESVVAVVKSLCDVGATAPLSIRVIKVAYLEE